jgi:hypothetical protein
MEVYIDRNSDTNYYQPPSNVSAWQGICPTDDPKKYLLTGTQDTGFGAIYKGTINIANSNDILTMKYPESTTTSVYGKFLISQSEIKNLAIINSQSEFIWT